MSPTKFGMVRGLISNSKSIAFFLPLKSWWMMVYKKKGSALFGELKSLMKMFYKPTFISEYSGFDSVYMKKVSP